MHVLEDVYRALLADKVQNLVQLVAPPLSATEIVLLLGQAHAHDLICLAAGDNSPFVST